MYKNVQISSKPDSILVLAAHMISPFLCPYKCIFQRLNADLVDFKRMEMRLEIVV